MKKFIDLKISGFSGSKDIKVNSLKYSANMNSPYKLSLSCDYRGADELNSEEMLYKNATLTLSDDNNKRYISGVVVACSQSSHSNSSGGYAFKDIQLTIASPLLLMDNHYNTRVFSQGKVTDYIKHIAGDYNLKIKEPISADIINREFCMQYNETDLNFLNRLCESEGIFYYFQQGNGSVIMKLGTRVSDYQQGTMIRLGKGKGKIDYSSISRSNSVLPKYCLVNDYDFTNPKKTIQHKQASKSNNTYDNSSATDYRPIFPARSFTDYNEKNNSAAGNIAKNIHGGRQSSYEELRLSVEGVWQEVDICDEISIDGNRKNYIVKDYTLHISESEFGIQSTAHFTLIEKQYPFRPELKTRIPHVPTQTATVVGSEKGNLNTRKDNGFDKNIMVKVKFHWDIDPEHTDDSSNCSCWIRSSQHSAGNMRGFVFAPRIGDEVLVSFEHGHPDMPIVTGSAYNGNNKLPYSLNVKKDISGIFSRTIPEGEESSSILFKDTQGKEELDFYTIGNQNTLIKKDKNLKVGGALNIQASSISLSAKDEDGNESFITITPSLINLMSKLFQKQVGGASNESKVGELENKK